MNRLPLGPAPEGPQRRYSPAECNGIRKIKVEGNTDPKHVSTSYVERQKLTMRCACAASLTNIAALIDANEAPVKKDLILESQNRV